MVAAAMRLELFTDSAGALIGGARPASGERVVSSRLQAYESGLGQKWHEEVLQRIIALTNRPDGWNGYGASALRRDTGMFALQVLHAIMLPRTPMPSVVPSAAGVQFEWHERDIDLEIHITGPYEWDIWFEDHTGQHQSVSEELANNFAVAGEAVSILTKR